jgi:hypothetical protein
MLLSRRCSMIPNETEIQKDRRESCLERIKTAGSRRPRMTPEEFYTQMERSMGTKMIPISSHGSSLVSKMEREKQDSYIKA